MSQKTFPGQTSISGRRWPVWPGGLIVLLVFLAYFPALHGGFIWDDDIHISANETLRSGQGLREIWFTPGATCQYYPLSFTFFWLGYQLWGLNPLGYHLLNVALHSLVAVLLWQILERLKVRGAWLAGAIFALHPVCVMSVAWMTEVKNTLSAALALGAGWAYLRFAGLGVYGAAAANDDKPEPRASGTDWRYGVLSLVLFLLAMFAKTAVSFLPVTLLLIVWWQQERLVWRKVAPLLLMLALVAVMGEATFYIEHLHGAMGTEFKLGWQERLLVSGRSFWFYLGKLFFPYPLTFIYERWNLNGAAGWQYLYPAATIGLFATLWHLRRITGKGPFVAVLHFYISTSLLILIVVLYMTRYSFVSDHWQYFGCMSVLTLTAAGITRVLDGLGKWNRFLKPVLVGTLLLVLGLLTRRQAAMYTDLETLWRTTLARNPDCWMAQNNLGYLLRKQGDIEKAIEHYQKAIQLNPNLSEARNNLGLALADEGRFDEAMENYYRAIQLDPNNSEAPNNLGLALTAEGRFDEAIKNYYRAIQLNPNFSEALNNLGLALATQGRFEEAVKNYRRAIQLNPNSPEALDNLARVLATSPDDPLRNGAEAVRLAERACVLTHYGQPVYIGTLAAAYAESGRFPEAVTTAEKAERLATAFGQPVVAAKNRQWLEFYRAGKPYHEPPPAKP